MEKFHLLTVLEKKIMVKDYPISYGVGNQEITQILDKITAPLRKGCHKHMRQ